MTQPADPPPSSTADPDATEPPGDPEATSFGIPAAASPSVKSTRVRSVTTISWR